MTLYQSSNKIIKEFVTLLGKTDQFQIRSEICNKKNF